MAKYWNLEFWFEHEMRQYPRFIPDMEALRGLADRLILAGGSDSRTSFPYRPNTVLAKVLHIPLADFPGGHLGCVTRATEFASQWATLLLDSPGSGRSRRVDT